MVFNTMVLKVELNISSTRVIFWDTDKEILAILAHMVKIGEKVWTMNQKLNNVLINIIIKPGLNISLVYLSLMSSFKLYIEYVCEWDHTRKDLVQS